MKKLFAILAVLVLFGTYAWATPATQNVNVTVTCDQITSVTCTTDPWNVTVAAGGSASTTFSWTVIGDGTGNHNFSNLVYTHSFPWNDGNGVELNVAGAVKGNWDYQGCNATCAVTGEATITVNSHATSGTHSFDFDLVVTY